MKYKLTSSIAIFLALGFTLATIEAQRQSNVSSSRILSSEQRAASEKALSQLRALRDGWNDVNRLFIEAHFTAGNKYHPNDYAVEYLETKDAVNHALLILPKSELRTAIADAMDIFDDLEAIS